MRVKRGLRFIQGGEKELVEKLGRNDPCPCGSGKRFQALLHALGPVSTAPSGMIIGGEVSRPCKDRAQQKGDLCVPVCHALAVLMESF